MNRIVFISLMILSLGSCKSVDPNFEYVPIEDINFEQEGIKDGTIIQILSFSGGPVCTPDATYYHQYIGINKENNDTVRILSPCQSITEDETPSQGSFSSWKDQSKLIEKVMEEHGENKFESDNKLVVFNKRQVEIEKREYKTFIGTLGF